MAHIKDYSEETAKLIDLEVKRILGDSYSRARTILDDNIDVLHSLSQALIERETLTGEEVAMIINGEELAAPVNGVKSAADAPAEPETSPTASGEEGFTLDEEDSGDKAGE
jgi:cell division protease FtsH